MPKISRSYLISRFVIVFSVLIAITLGIAVWDINPWPTDAEAYYLPAALRVPHLQYLSELHPAFDIEKVRWLHGKEFYIAAISVFQHLLNDFESLRPLMVLGLVAVALSSILIFFIARRFWGEKAALACYLLFTFSFWPYLYILFAKHQTLGLMFFLVSLAVLLKLSSDRVRVLCPVLSGLSFGLSFFSSTVSSLYVPLYTAGFFALVNEETRGLAPKKKTRMFAGSALLAAAGFLAVFFYVNLPDIVYNIKSFKDYVVISGAFNHFYYNQIHLQQWLPGIDVGKVRGGWEWVIKYFFVAMPVVFPLYLGALGYLLFRILKEKSLAMRLQRAGIIFLSLTAPLMAETVRVAQYGANYFPALIGIIALIGYTIHDLKNYGARISDFGFRKKHRDPLSVIRNPFFVVVIVILLFHGVYNFYLFATDVYPCRMATTFLSNKLKELKVEKLWSYRVNRHRNFFVFCLDPELRDRIGWLPLQYLPQAEFGHILVPPSTGDSLYIAARSSYSNFSKDPFLVQLIRKKMLKDCSVASFRTLANSRIWVHEEEILTYRRLVLGQDFPEEDLGRAWLLDAKKVLPLVPQLFPPKEEALVAKGRVFNIGTAEKFYMFEGQRGEVKKKTLVKALVVKLWKVGDPKDGLIAAMFRSDKVQDTWIPFPGNSASRVLTADAVPVAGGRGYTVFEFDPPIEIEPGQFYFAIFRTGKPDDRDYYQLEAERFGIK